MGRHIKNNVLASSTGAVLLPVGSNTIIPSSPVDGHMIYNSTNQRIEYYMDGAWHPFAQDGKVSIVQDTFTGDDATTGFGPMSYSYIATEEAQVLVFVNSVVQDPTTDYTFNGSSTITFTGIPVNGAPIAILHNFSSTSAVS